MEVEKEDIKTENEIEIGNNLECTMIILIIVIGIVLIVIFA